MEWEKAIQRYQAYLLFERALSANTIEAYTRDIRKLARYCEQQHPPVPLGAVSRDTLSAFMAGEYDEMADTSRARLVSGLKSFFKYLVLEGKLTLERLVEVMSVLPGRLFGLGGALTAGAPADVALFDLEARYKVDPATFRSMGHATPFEGWDVQGRCVMTLVDGRTAYERR